MLEIIDAHIHLDMYKQSEQQEMIDSLQDYHVEGLISVSNHLQSAKANLALAKKYPFIKPAFGYHPEQVLPKQVEIEQLFDFIADHHEEMIAIGEVGLPYYLKRKQAKMDIQGYVELLEQFILLAQKYAKPIILHAIYEDAVIACDLLEKHSIKKAHFHWFKGDAKTSQRIIDNGYYISITPDVIYETEIQALVEQFPLNQLMVETDGPWQFEKLFRKKRTHPKMIHDTISQIAELKQEDIEVIYHVLYANTVQFYNFNKS